MISLWFVFGLRQTTIILLDHDVIYFTKLKAQGKKKIMQAKLTHHLKVCSMVFK